MKECKKCGTHNPDGVKRCQNCGSEELEYVRITESKSQSGSGYTQQGGSAQQSGYTQGAYTQQGTYPQPGMYPQQYPMSYQVYDPYKASFYGRLGGFLKFTVIMNYISGVGSIIMGLITLISYLRLSSMISSWGGRASAIINITGIVMFAVYVVTGVISFVYANKIKSKDPDFLRFIQIVYSISMILAFILIVFEIFLRKNNAYYSSPSAQTIFYLVFGLFVFIVWNFYFCCSERVYYYMGSATYIKRSIFTSWVKRWDAIEASRLSMEEPSSLEKIRMGISDLQTNGSSSTYIPPKPATNSQPAASAVSTIAAPSTASTMASASAASAVNESRSGLSLEDMEALKKLKELFDLGAISEEEYNNFRSKYIPGVAEGSEGSETGVAGETGTSAGQSEEPEQEKPEDIYPWKCNDCKTVNPPEKKVCSYCGGIKLITGYTLVTGEEPVEEMNKEPAQQEAPQVQQAAPQIAPQPQKVVNTDVPRFCGKCGAPLVPGGKFCMTCGSPVD